MIWRRRHDWVLALGAGLCLLPACQLPGSGLRGARATAPAETAHPVETTAADPGTTVLTDPPKRPPPPRGVEVASSEYGSLPAPTPANAIVPARGTPGENNIAPVGVNVAAPGASGRRPPVDLERPPTNPGVRPVGPVEPPKQPAWQPAEPQENPSARNAPREPALLTALRAYLDKRPDDALAALAQYDKFSQEMLICLLPLLVELSEAREMPEQQRALILEQLHSLTIPLRARAPLVIARMCLCKSIDTFGVYERLPDDHVFQAGEQVLIYAEVQNFTSERVERKSGRPIYVTRLGTVVTIRNEARKAVWKQECQRVSPDQSQTLRHDYFDHYTFCLPDLRPGWYKLEIQVEDLATHRKARRAVDLKVGLLQGS